GVVQEHAVSGLAVGAERLSGIGGDHNDGSGADGGHEPAGHAIDLGDLPVGLGKGVRPLFRGGRIVRIGRIGQMDPPEERSACAYARVKTIDWGASPSSEGVSLRVDPRKPMRSARVVSSVIRRMLGFAASTRLPSTDDRPRMRGATTPIVNRPRIKKGRSRGPV